MSAIIETTFSPEPLVSLHPGGRFLRADARVAPEAGERFARGRETDFAHGFEADQDHSGVHDILRLGQAALERSRYSGQRGKLGRRGVEGAEPGNAGQLGDCAEASAHRSRLASLQHDLRISIDEVLRALNVAVDEGVSVGGANERRETECSCATTDRAESLGPSEATKRYRWQVTNHVTDCAREVLKPILMLRVHLRRLVFAAGQEKPRRGIAHVIVEHVKRGSVRVDRLGGAVSRDVRCLGVLVRDRGQRTFECLAIREAEALVDLVFAVALRASLPGPTLNRVRISSQE
jgi:hypothetical protein